MTVSAYLKKNPRLAVEDPSQHCLKVRMSFERLGDRSCITCSHCLMQKVEMIWSYEYILAKSLGRAADHSDWLAEVLIGS